MAILLPLIWCSLAGYA